MLSSHSAIPRGTLLKKLFSSASSSGRITDPLRIRMSKSLATQLASSTVSLRKMMPREISKFITAEKWSVRHNVGSKFACIERTVEARKVQVEWMLPMSVFDESRLEFRIHIEDKLTPQGMVFTCFTRQRRTHRFVIKFLQCYGSFSERDSAHSYEGPRFDTLEPQLQAAFDETLHAWGIDGEVIDFIEASSKYYKNAEYINWLHNVSEFISK